MTYFEIAEEIGRTKKSVRIKLNKMGCSQSERSKINRKNKVYEELICLNCGKNFTAYKRNKQKFCSQSCNASHNNKKRIINNPDKKKKANCVHCGKDILISNYASLKTASCLECNPKYGVNRKECIENVKRIDGKFICVNCGEKLNRKGKYCSKGCEIEFKRNEIFKKIESGDTTLATHIYKKYLIYKYGEKCMECNWNEVNPYSKKVPIEIEHIDGNSENNDLKNLKLLCPNCHSLTPTYRALNIGNGRYKRRERYQKGKSF